MAKQQGKMTREQKIADAAAKKAAEATSLMTKGAEPDFAPKAVHTDLDRLKHARESGRYDDMVMGMLGTYYVGFHNETKVTKAFDFTVKPSDGLTIIEDEDGIRIPLDYLFEPTVTTQDKFFCYLAPGRIGDIQFQMIGFLQEALAPEIEIEKGVRCHRLLSLRKAMEVSQEISPAAPTFTLTVVGGTDVKPAPQVSEVLEVKEFVPENYGIFNFYDGEHSCHVEYASGQRGNSVTIVKIDSGHCLALIGAEVGTKLFAKCLARSFIISESAPNREALTAFQAFLFASIDAAVNEKQKAA